MECLMDHIVLNMEDEEKMIPFYTGVLMLEPERLEEYDAGDVPFPSVRLNSNTIIDLFPKRMWQNGYGDKQGRKHLNHICFALRIDEWQALLQRLREKRINIEEGPVSRWGAHGTGTSIYFRDPEGNMLEARYYEDGQSSARCLLGS
jgi:catechol 2,3-dioxygenase-like lactoylglutathione lyase family enzyme